MNLRAADNSFAKTRPMHSLEPYYPETVDGGERVRGLGQMFGHAVTPSGTPQAGGPLQVSRLPTCSLDTTAVFRLESVNAMALGKVN